MTRKPLFILLAKQKDIKKEKQLSNLIQEDLEIEEYNMSKIKRYTFYKNVSTIISYTKIQDELSNSI